MRMEQCLTNNILVRINQFSLKIMSEISVMCIFTSKVEHIKWHRWPAPDFYFIPFLPSAIYLFIFFPDAVAVVVVVIATAFSLHSQK